MSSRAARKRAYRTEQGVAALFAFGCHCGAKPWGVPADADDVFDCYDADRFISTHTACMWLNATKEPPTTDYVPREGGDWPSALEIVAVDHERKRIDIAGVAFDPQPTAEIAPEALAERIRQLHPDMRVAVVGTCITLLPAPSG